MRYAIQVGGVMLVLAAVFSSCTCRSQVGEAPKGTFKEGPGGFRASGATTPAQRAAGTPSPAAQQPGEMAAGAVPLPDDFPKEVPVFKDAVVAQVQNLANDAHNVLFFTAAPVSEVTDFYENQLKGSGWKITQQFKRNNRSFATYQKGDMIANVTVAEMEDRPGQQVIAVMYEQQKPLGFEEF